MENIIITKDYADLGDAKAATYFAEYCLRK